MSRLTGKDALGMFEAYQAVYTHQEKISEEQIWEEVEAWVKSLVEDGNDLSEFTWEEMYEAYLSEAGMDVFSTPAMRDVKVKQAAQFYSGKKPEKPENPDYLKAAKSAAQKQAAEKIFKLKQGSLSSKPVIPDTRPSGSSPTARPSGAPSAKPAAAAKPAPATSAKPAPTAAAKPASSSTSYAGVKPATGAFSGNASISSAARPASAAPAKTPNPLMQRTFGYQTGNAPDQQRARANAIIQSGAVKALSPTPAAAKPTSTPAATGSKKPGSVYSSFDMFDVVKGHLIGEGYAETEEAAIAIMANMSEEWKASIISKVAD